MSANRSVAGGRHTSDASIFDRDANALIEGSEFVSRGRTICEADLVQFAGLTGDWHPQHADAEWAAESRFGARVAHGMLTLSYAVGLVPFDPERVVALRGFDSVAFKRPVLIGDTIRVRVRVGAVRPLDAEHALVAMVWRIVNQNDALVARAQVSALWRAARADDPDDGPRTADRTVEAERAAEALYGDRVLL